MADGTERPYVITQESLDRRHSTDMHAFVLRLSATEAAVGAQMESRQPLSVLIVHGTADTVVPVQDAREYYQLFTSETAISPYLRCRLFLMDCVDHFYSGVTVEQLRNLIGWDFYSK
jgi:fermentation-respiration switch protein FrsA (DUF1100 family)